MKHSKKMTRLLALGCVLAVSCGAALTVTHMESRKEQIKNSDAVILQLPSESVTALSWTNETDSLSFHREDGIWRYDADEAFPVSGGKMEELLSLFESFGAAFEITDVEDFSQYGLDEPVCTIRVTTSDTSQEAASQTYEILLGDYSTMDAQRYVSIGDGKVYLVSEDPLELFDAGLQDMIEQDEDLAYSKVYEIRFSGLQNYTITREEESPDALSDEDLYFTDHNGVRTPLDTDQVAHYLESMVTLNPINYVTYQATEEALSAYGLDTPELTVTVDYETAESGDEPVSRDTFVIHIGRNADAAAAAEAANEALGPEEEPEQVPAYIRIGESRIIYEITDSQYRALTAASFNDLRHPEVFPVDLKDADRIDITLEESSCSLVNIRPNSGDPNPGWYFGSEKIETAPLEAVLSDLTANEFTTETPSGKEEISMVFSLDLAAHPTLEIRLYRRDAESCLAVVDGEPFALVDRKDVVDLIEAVHAITLSNS